MKNRFIIFLLLFASCKKNVQLHKLGAMPEDPARVAALPVITSTHFRTTVIPTAYQINMPPVGDQGNEGTCTAFAVGYYTRSTEQYYKTGVTSYSVSTNIFSPEYLFDQIKTDASTCSNSTIIDALELLKAKGICTWNTMPYSSWNGCSIKIRERENREAANYKISSYATVLTTDITAIKTLLVNNHPLIISFMVDDSFMWAHSGFIWSSHSSTIYGLHCVAMCGFDDTKNAFKIINSWGTGWADAGYCWIDYNFLPTICSNAYVMNI